MDSGRRSDTLFWTVVFALFLFTRWPAFSNYLSIDNVNLAFALEKFDPRVHQPQPPGYPLFVLKARAVNFVVRDPETTFRLLSLGVSALCLPLAFFLARRMFGDWQARAAVLLLLVNPVFWFGSIESPLRPFLALFSLLTAYCGWRCWHGERQYLLLGAVALGIGSGFRPDLGPFLFPLWLLCAWMGTRSVVEVAKGTALMAIVVGAWLSGMAYAVGGFGALYQLNAEYAVSQSARQSLALGATERAWIRQLSRLVVWNGTAMLAWIWSIPIFLKFRDRVQPYLAHMAFVLVWVLPGMLFQGIVHVEDPGHTLFSIPAWCILGGGLLFAAIKEADSMRETLLALGLVLNTMLFVGFLELPAASEPTGGLHSLKNTVVFSTFETSLDRLRYMNNAARTTLDEMKTFAAKDRPTVIVTSDVDTGNWFLNWRIARYYLPTTDMWVLTDLVAPHTAQRIRRDIATPAVQGAPVQVPVPRGGRVIWMIEPGGPFQKALKQALPGVTGGAYLSYTDIGVETTPFRVMDFEFVPTGSK